MDASFGALLRAHRRARGLTQEALAERAALSGQAVGALERGDRRFPHRDTVERLAVALGLDDAQRAAFAEAAARPSMPRPVETPASLEFAPPQQLPAATVHFTGRAAAARTVLNLLDRSTAVVVSAISGMAGIGKTAFAVHCAHQIRDRFPDGQLYANLRGFDPARPPADPAGVVRAFLEALHVAPRRIPASPEAQVGLYRSLLAGRRMLIVLDNALDAEQVRPLLPGTPGCLALITSRHQLTSLAATDGAQLVTLDLLGTGEARELLAARLGDGRVAAEPRAVDAIIERCGRLPLALAIVAARAAANPRFPLAALAAELGRAGDSLDALQSGDAVASVRTAFSLSYEALSPAAARLFRLLGLHPGPDIATNAAASLAGLAVRRLRPQLGELTNANLIAEHLPGRFTLHDLVRAYAVEQAQSLEPEAERRAATHRMLDHYLHSAGEANRRLAPERDWIESGAPQPGTAPEKIGDREAAIEWFDAERAVLLSIVDLAAAGGWDTHTWQLAWSFTDFLSRHGDWQADISIQRAALAAAQRLGDGPAQARAHRFLALDYSQLGRYDEALAELESALELTARAGDPRGQAHTHNHLAFVWERQGRNDQALYHSEQALMLYRAADHRPGQADALNAVGWIHAQLGNYEQALDYCAQALASHEELRNLAGRAAALDSLGYAHHHLGRHDAAIACYEQAIQLHRDLGNRYFEAKVLTHLGDTHRLAHGPRAAAKCWRQALDILTDLDHADATDVRARLDNLNA